MNKGIYSFLLLFILVNVAAAQSAHKQLRSGDKSYESSDFQSAEEDYRKSLEKENTVKGRYNLGNSIYQQKRFDEAIKQYNEVIGATNDNTIRQNAYHNLGNAHFSKEEYDKSVEAYKNALRLDPKSLETKKNLAQAMRLVRQQQQQQQQQQQDQEKSEEEQEEEQQQQQQQQEQTDENEQEQQQQQQQSEAEETPQEKDLNKEEARKLLQIMEDEEKEVQKKMKKGDGKKGKAAKDW